MVVLVYNPSDKKEEEIASPAESVSSRFSETLSPELRCRVMDEVPDINLRPLRGVHTNVDVPI